MYFEHVCMYEVCMYDSNTDKPFIFFVPIVRVICLDAEGSRDRQDGRAQFY